MRQYISLIIFAVLAVISFFVASNIKDSVGIVIEDLWNALGVAICGLVGLTFLVLFILKLVKVLF